MNKTLPHSLTLIAASMAFLSMGATGPAAALPQTFEAPKGTPQDLRWSPPLGPAADRVRPVAPSATELSRWATRYAAEYQVKVVDSGHRAANPGQAWSTHFDGRGFLTQPDDSAWVWGLELESYGFPGQEHTVDGSPEIDVLGGRISYGWSAGLIEWYENDTRGLEHGYTVHDRPRSARGMTGEVEQPESLVFRIRVRGALRPVVTGSGRDVDFLDAAGDVVISYSGLSVFDAKEEVLDASFEIVGGDLLLSIDEQDARYPLTIDPTARQAMLRASNYNSLDEFGYAIAIDGDTMVVGARSEQSSATGVNGDENDDTDYSIGACYVFVRTGTTWTQQAYLKSSNAEAPDLFGQSVAILGDTIAVGAFGESSAAPGVGGDQSNNDALGAGAVYIFTRTGTTWSQQAYLKASNPGELDYFGWRVSLSGDRLAVGAYGEASQNGVQTDNSAVESGAVYVFLRSAGSWTQEAYLKASNIDAGDYFGYSVGLSGDSLVVGAPYEASSATGINGDQNDNTGTAGAAYAFRRSGGSWVQEAYIKPSNTDVDMGPGYGEQGDCFGYSVTISDDTILVGAPCEDSQAAGVNGDQTSNDRADSGAAYVFVRQGGAWSQETYLKASNPQVVAGFGYSVAASRGTLLVGAVGENGWSTVVNGAQCDGSSGTPIGAAYVFTRNGPSWTQQDYLKPANAIPYLQFGTSVALSQATAVVGQPGWQAVPSDNSAYVFALEPSLFESYCCSESSLGGSLSSSGASLTATGDPNSSLILTSYPVPETAGQFFFGPMMLAGSPFGDGYLCVGGMTQRLLPLVTAGMMMQAANTASIAISYSAPYAAALTGTQHFQHWYRSGLATGSGFNTSNAISITF